MRIINFPRFILTMIIVILLITFILMFITGSSLSYSQVVYTSICVSQGDTLWNIAKDLKENNTNYCNKEIREIIYEIKQLNNLNNSELKIGQELLVQQ